MLEHTQDICFWLVESQLAMIVQIPGALMVSTIRRLLGQLFIFHVRNPYLHAV